MCIHFNVDGLALPRSVFYHPGCRAAITHPADFGHGAEQKHQHSQVIGP